MPLSLHFFDLKDAFWGVCVFVKIHLPQGEILCHRSTHSPKGWDLVTDLVTLWVCYPFSNIGGLLGLRMERLQPLCSSSSIRNLPHSLDRSHHILLWSAVQSPFIAAPGAWWESLPSNERFESFCCPQLALATSRAFCKPYLYPTATGWLPDILVVHVTVLRNPFTFTFLQIVGWRIPYP